MNQNKINILFALSSIIGSASKSGADVDNMDDNDFNAELDKLLSGSDYESKQDDLTDIEQPDDSEDDNSETADGQEEEETDSNDEQDSEDNEDQDEDEEEDDSDDDSEDDESEDEEPEEKEDSEKYSLNELPMDVQLPFEIKANGIEMKATLGELIQGFQKGVNYTSKMQEMKRMLKPMSIMDEANLTEEDLNLLANIKSGSKEALSKLVHDLGVDPMELDDGELKDFTPKEFGKEQPDMEYEAVKESIINDTDVIDDFKSAVNTMPDDMYAQIEGNAGNLQALYMDIKSGVYKQVMPEVIKQRSLGNQMPSLDLYIAVARQLSQNGDTSKEQENTPDPKQVSDKTVREKRKKAKSSTSRRKTVQKTIINDVSSLDSDEFAKKFSEQFGVSLNDFK